MSDAAARNALCRMGQRLYDRHLVLGTSGNRAADQRHHDEHAHVI